jgi:hypothetical protein
VACLTALGLVLALAGTALGGNTGYEGQPGNQSNGGGGNNNTGYEGQPGNQSH